jgi:hypothetical protein
MAKRKTEEESLAQRKPDAPQLPKVEIDFETLVAAGIAAAIIRSPKKRGEIPGPTQRDKQDRTITISVFFSTLGYTSSEIITSLILGCDGISYIRSTMMLYMIARRPRAPDLRLSAIYFPILGAYCLRKKHRIEWCWRWWMHEGVEGPASGVRLSFFQPASNSECRLKSGA